MTNPTCGERIRRPYLIADQLKPKPKLIETTNKTSPPPRPTLLWSNVNPRSPTSNQLAAYFPVFQCHFRGFKPVVSLRFVSQLLIFTPDHPSRQRSPATSATRTLLHRIAPGINRVLLCMTLGPLPPLREALNRTRDLQKSKTTSRIPHTQPSSHPKFTPHPYTPSPTVSSQPLGFTQL